MQVMYNQQPGITVPGHLTFIDYEDRLMPKTNSIKKTCSLPDCDRKHYGRGYCNMHYQRFMRRGNTDPVQIHDNARFDSYIELIPFSTCHYWVGPLTPQGYGQVYVDGKMLAAHRYAYERANGPIPDGGFILHSCHDPACCNPDHLRVGNHEANMRDMVLACRQARGGDHGMVKLTADDVIVIRADTRQQRTIAADYGVCHATIGRIKRRETWGHV